MSKLQTRPFAGIYNDLKDYPSEHVYEAIEGLRLTKKAITSKAAREILDRRVQIAAKVAEMPAAADVAHLARVSALCQPKPDRLDEKIARCMTRKGISRREEVLYQRELKRYPIADWGYYPPSNWYESECRCGKGAEADHDPTSLPFGIPT